MTMATLCCCALGGLQEEVKRIPYEKIRALIERKSAEEQKCYMLYTLLLSRWSPPPSLDIWIDFGFASCASEAEEGVLGSQYQRLIAMCTFKEFCDAYRNRRLLDLFHAKGLQVNTTTQLQDLLSSGLWRKSVWSLKKFVLQEASADEQSGMAPSITVDYGFVNCKNASERRHLKKVYKDFFTFHHGDPLALHEACIKGNIYGFISNIIQDLHGPKYQRLMKNLYPLPDPDASSESPSGDNDDEKVQVDETGHAPSPLPDQDESSKSSSGDVHDGDVQACAPPAWQVSSVVFGAVLGGVLAMFWMQVRSS